MPAPGKVHAGPLADAVILYSQHLARPPATPPTGSKLKQARKRPHRRPRSAAVVLTSRLMLVDSSSVTHQPAGGEYPSRPVQRGVRPSSAAATAIKSHHPTRPARRRPATAGGMAKNSRTSMPDGKALRRRVVSAGNTPSSRAANHHRDTLAQNRVWSSALDPETSSCKISSNNNSGGGVIARGSRWGHATDVAIGPEVGEEGASGGGFWHKHHDIGLDPKVMERATEFVANILEGRRNSRGGVGLSPPQFLVNSASSRNSYQGNRHPSMKHTHDEQKIPGLPRPQRPKRRVVMGAEISFAAGSTRSVVGKQGMHCTSKVNERAVEHLPGGATGVPQSSRTHAFRSGDGLVVCEGDHEAVIGVLGVLENSGGGSSDGGDTRAEEACDDTSRARNSNTQSGEGPSALTPLALDVFSSLRPTLELRAKSRPMKSAVGRCTSRSNCRSRGVRPTMEENAPYVWKGLANSPTPVPQPHQLLADRKVCTWTSVFGAVCAGAERGRARAEVLQAARRKIQQPQSIQATNSRVNTSRNEVVKEASVTAIAVLTCAESTIDEQPAGEDLRPATSDAFADHNNPTESKPIPTIEEKETTGRQPGKNSEGGRTLMVCDVGKIMPPEIDVSKESPIARYSQGVSLHPSTAELTPRSITAASTRSTAQAERLPSPLFRPPTGSTLTRVGTNTPCRLQVSPGEQRFTGLDVFTYTPFRQSSAGSATALTRSGRRPSTAGGVTFGDATEHGNSNGRNARHPRGAVRPATSGGFFKTLGGKRKGVGGVNSWCGQGFISVPARSGTITFGLTDGSTLRRRVDRISEGIAEDLKSRPDAPSHFTKDRLRGYPSMGNDAAVQPCSASEFDFRDPEQTVRCAPQGVAAAPTPRTSVTDTSPCSEKDLQGLKADSTGCKHLNLGKDPNGMRVGGEYMSTGDQEHATAAVGSDMPDQVTALPAPDARVNTAASSSRKRRRPRPDPEAMDTSTDCVRPRSFSEGYPPGTELVRPRRSTSCPGLFQEISSWTFLPRRNRRFYLSQPVTLEETPHEDFQTSTNPPHRGHDDDGKLADARRARGVKFGSSGNCGDGTDAASKKPHSRTSAEINEEQRHIRPHIMKARAVSACSTETRSESRKVGVPGAVTTALDFQNAAVKLKCFAAESAAAIDGHEMAWALSKVEAEVLFNDCRLVAEEDAQEAGDNAELEIRRRLYRILTQFGLEESLHAEKKAALEEAQRVLQQDTRMYAARMEASERMTEEMRALEADNDDADMMILLEQRRSQSLQKMKERTEREIDERRAGCQRLREEANMMDTTLEEARHARGLLVGHVQNIVERMACQADRVSVTRRWCRDRLRERRHARATSRSINRQFERKNKKVEFRLRKQVDRGTALPPQGHHQAMAAALTEIPKENVPVAHAVFDADHDGGAFAELEHAAMRLRALLVLCAAAPGSCIASNEGGSIQSTSVGY